MKPNPAEPSVKLPDPVEFSRTMAKIAERSQRLVAEFLARQQGSGQMGMNDPLNLGAAFMEMTTKLMSDPVKLVQAQMSLWQDYMTLWQNATLRALGQDTKPLVEATPGDRRFKDSAWEENMLFDFIKQSYLLSARWVQQTVAEVEGLDPKTAK